VEHDARERELQGWRERFRALVGENHADAAGNAVIRLKSDRDAWRSGCGRWQAAALDLAKALVEAMAAVRVFHGPVGWDLYRDFSPEMERWRGLLRKVGIAIPVDLEAATKAEARRDRDAP
jgi:hypothetical protein